MSNVCKKGYVVGPQRSAAGWYLGTVDEDGCPNCKLTTNYAKTAEAARSLRIDRQDAMENRFCNGCGSCEITERK